MEVLTTQTAAADLLQVQIVSRGLGQDLSGNNPDADAHADDHEDQNERPDIFCRFCDHGVTNRKQTVSINGQTSHTFFNPAGIVYEVRCFNGAAGCVVRGKGTAEFSWFAGYIWSYALCGRCRAHLGWWYSAAEHSFFGLIAQNIREDS